MLSPAPDSTPETLQKDKPASQHWPSIWQFGLSLFTIFCLWGLAILLLVMGLIDRFSQTVSNESTSLILIAAGLAFFGVLLLPTSGFALARLLGRTLNPPPWLSLDRIRKGILILPLVLVAGHWLVTQTDLTWILFQIF